MSCFESFVSASLLIFRPRRSLDNRGNYENHQDHKVTGIQDVIHWDYVKESRMSEPI